MRTPLVDVLQDCLQRIEAGEDPERVLQRHPELRVQLVPLLRTALVVRTRRPKPSPAFRARLQVRLADLLASEQPRRPFWRPLVVRLAGIALALLLVLSGMVVASANSRPGDRLYPVRRGFEQARAAAAELARPMLSVFAPPADSTVSGGSGAPAATLTPRALRSAVGSAPTAQVRRPSASRRSHVPRASDPSDDASAAKAEVPLEPPATPHAAEGGMASVPTSVMATVPAPATLAASAAVPAMQMPSSATLRAVVPTPRVSPTPGLSNAGATTTPSPTVRPQFVVTVIPSPTPNAQARAGSGGTIRGRVVREDGRPMVLMVAAYAVPNGQADPLPFTRFWARTNGDGGYRLENLPPGVYKIAASEGGWFNRRRWYPDTWNPREATAIPVAEGSVIEGIDIRYELHHWDHTLP